MATLDDSKEYKDRLEDEEEDSDEDLEISTYQIIQSKLLGISLFLNLDKLDNIKVLRTVSNMFHLRVKTVAMVFLILTSLSFVMWIGGTIIYSFYAYVLPAYQAFKALEIKSRKKRDKLILHYLRYFIVFSFLYWTSPFIGIVVPYWNILEILIIYGL